MVTSDDYKAALTVLAEQLCLRCSDVEDMSTQAWVAWALERVREARERELDAMAEYGM